jgi:hypothetical protein
VANPGIVFVQIARSDGTMSNVVNFTVPIVQELHSSVGGFNAVDAATPGLTLTVNGARFGSGDIVNWTFGGVTTRLPTTFVSTAQVVASVSAALLLEPGIASITVTRGIGQASNVVPFFIFAPDPSHHVHADDRRDELRAVIGRQAERRGIGDDLRVVDRAPGDDLVATRHKGGQLHDHDPESVARRWRF